jgi:hypothetical protein
MDRFEYVMVLISIIVGLSIANVLVGVGGMIDRKADGPPLRLGLAHGAWLAFVFWWTVQFWWWEFRFSELVEVWTLGLYLFLVGYAVALFLLVVVLVPRTWEGVDDLDAHFLQRRVWFYWGLGLVTVIDVVDGLLKGGPAYIADFGGWIWVLWGVTAVACVVGLTSTKLRHHRLAAVAAFACQVLSGFEDLPTLGF